MSSQKIYLKYILKISQKICKRQVKQQCLKGGSTRSFLKAKTSTSNIHAVTEQSNKREISKQDFGLSEIKKKTQDKTEKKPTLPVLAFFCILHIVYCIFCILLPSSSKLKNQIQAKIYMATTRVSTRRGPMNSVEYTV